MFKPKLQVTFLPIPIKHILPNDVILKNQSAKCQTVSLARTHQSPKSSMITVKFSLIRPFSSPIKCGYWKSDLVLDKKYVTQDTSSKKFRLKYTPKAEHTKSLQTS